MFIRRTVAKNKDGSKREYFQLAESVRINGKPRNRVICTLGRVGDPDTDTKIKDMSLSLMKACEEFKFFDLATAFLIFAEPNPWPGSQVQNNGA